MNLDSLKLIERYTLIYSCINTSKIVTKFTSTSGRFKLEY